MRADNNCKKLLKNVKLLQELLVNENIPEAFDFIQNFKNFRNVVNSGFKNNLSPDFSEHIYAFLRSFLSTQITVTPKCHMLFYHDMIHNSLGIAEVDLVVCGKQSTEEFISVQWPLTRFKMNTNCPNYALNCLVV